MDQGYQAFVGIDISKEVADFHILPSGGNGSVDNDEQGHAKLLRNLPQPGSCLIVIEATGGLEEDLFLELADNGHHVAIVNPMRPREFAKSLGQLAKTDKIDACVLALFAERILPRVTPLPSPENRRLRQFVARRRQLIQLKVAEGNRLKKGDNEAISKSLKKHLTFLERQIADIDREIDRLVKSVPQMAENAERLTSVPGVGQKTAITVVAELPEIGNLSSKQVAAIAGVAPMNRDSGKYKGKRRIRGGRSHLRSALYMAALTAARMNPVIAEFAQRLKEKGKPAKVVLTACIRKLLTILNALVKKKQIWQQKSAVPA